MKTAVLFLIFHITSVLLLATPVNMLPVQSDGGDSSSNISVTTGSVHFSLSRYTEMVHQLIQAMQTIWTVLADHVRNWNNIYIHYSL